MLRAMCAVRNAMREACLAANGYQAGCASGARLAEIVLSEIRRTHMPSLLGWIAKDIALSPHEGLSVGFFASVAQASVAHDHASDLCSDGWVVQPEAGVDAGAIGRDQARPHEDTEKQTLVF
jgi:hypothetical protein